MAVLNLEDQLVFYRSYHFNTVNVLIHSVFVPLILFSSFGLSNNISVPYIDLKLGEAVSIGYALFYILLKWQVGLIATPIVLGFGFGTSKWLEADPDYATKAFWTLFIVGWVIQFIGHGVFEKRAPALLDNLVQALVLAPYFVLFEGLFLIGFYRDLKTRIDARVIVNIEKFRNAGSAGNAGKETK